MERPQPEQPLDIRPFLELVDETLYPTRSGGINMVGDSTTAVLLVFGPDSDEVQAVQDRLSVALLDYVEWHKL